MSSISQHLISFIAGSLGAVSALIAARVILAIVGIIVSGISLAHAINAPEKDVSFTNKAVEGLLCSLCGFLPVPGATILVFAGYFTALFNLKNDPFGNRSKLLALFPLLICLVAGYGTFRLVNSFTGEIDPNLLPGDDTATITETSDEAEVEDPTQTDPSMDDSAKEVTAEELSDAIPKETVSFQGNDGRLDISITFHLADNTTDTIKAYKAITKEELESVILKECLQQGKTKEPDISDTLLTYYNGQIGGLSSIDVNITKQQ